MSRSITYLPPDRPAYDPPKFFILERRPPGPWGSSRVVMEIPDRDEAVRAARSRLQWDEDLLVRVIDQYGTVHWSNEDKVP